MRLGGLACVAAIGCVPRMAGDGLFAFPPTGPDDEPIATSSTTLVEGEEHAPPTGMRMRFRSHAPPENIRTAACGLHASLSLGGVSRPVDVRVETTPCGAPTEGALEATVEIGAEEVVLRLAVPEGTPPEAMRELEQGLREIEAELERRVASIPRPAAPLILPAPVPRGRRSTKWFYASAVMGGVGAGILATGAIVTGAGAAAKDEGTKNTGVVIMSSFAAPIGILMVLTLSIGLILASSGD